MKTTKRRLMSSNNTNKLEVIKIQSEKKVQEAKAKE